jgi:hypothetical protein
MDRFPAKDPPQSILHRNRAPILRAMAPQGKQRKRLEAGEDQYGSIFSVSGPVIVAENMIGCAMYELVSRQDVRSGRYLSDASVAQTI